MGNTENKIQARTSRHLASWVGIIILTSCVFAIAQDKSHSAGPQDSWLKEHLLNDQAQLPVSFVYDRQGSGALLKTWTKKIDTKELDSVRT